MQAICFCNLKTRQINHVLIHPRLKEKGIEKRMENAVERSRRRQWPMINFFKIKL